MNFITFEGIEGSGKSTQAKMLHNYLKKCGFEAILTREPGGTKMGEKIREILLNDERDNSSYKVEILLNYASRINHMEELILPAINNGKKVISDRFFDSTFVYQGFAQDNKTDLIEKIHNVIMQNFKPDITFLIDLDVEIAQKRIFDRKDRNYFDQMPIAFHQKVRNGFLDIASKNSDRIKIINGNQNSTNIHQDILKYI